MRSRCALNSEVRRLAAALLTVIAAFMISAPTFAQQNTVAQSQPGNVTSPILTIDRDRLFKESTYGIRLIEEDQQRVRALEAENERIASDLEAEERRITQQRAATTPEEFLKIADAFDQKVQETRAARAAKARELNQLLEAERDAFFQAAAPLLEQLMRQAGAAVIFERRSVFVSLSAVDITDEAIALLDKTFGNGPVEER